MSFSKLITGSKYMNIQRLRKFFIVAVVSLFLVPLLAACGGSGAINASLTEDYKIQLSKTTAKAGSITFHVTNNATDLNHEFVIVKTDLQAADLPLNSDGNVDETKLDIIGRVPQLEPGKSQDLTVDLAAGHYVIMCNLPGHYAQGMYTDFSVQ